jgi:hypothetical protein
VSGRRAEAVKDLAAIGLLALTAALVLADALWGGRVLLPSGLLRQMLPWARAVALPESPPAWNPLLWDGIAQFYPWRDFAARWIAEGVFPLWNPHQFCGTPFFANSQSALFYPLNALFYLPGPLTTAQRFVWLAFIHLSLAGTGTYGWLRATGCGRAGAFLAGLAFMLSGFAVTWLELPTLLSVACWIPPLLLAIHQTLRRRSLSCAALAGLALGLMLLGGHLQIAFYGILAASAYACFEIVAGSRRKGGRGREGGSEGAREGTAPSAGSLPLPLFAVKAALLAAALGFSLAAPQVLPALELSRFSHRAAPPSAEGYRAYVNYAVPAAHLITLFLPDFYGNPTRNRYWGAANYAEYAAYTGAATLLLALLGGVAGWRRHRLALFLTLLAAGSLWMASGAPLNALFYFGVPGFGQSGSPGRILVLFCLAAATLAGLGLDTVLAGTAAPAEAARRIWEAVGVAVLLWALFFGVTRQLAASALAGAATPFATAWEMSLPAAKLGLVLTGAVVAALAAGVGGLRSGKLSPELAWLLAAGVPILVVLADLYFFATGFLLTSPSQTVYPATSLTQRLQTAQASPGGGRMLPLNGDWSLSRSPRVVLPPNAALAYGLSDVQGYDSLYLLRFKALANAIQGADTSPIQNGNMLFLTNTASPLFPLLGVRNLVTVGSPPASLGRPSAREDGAAIVADPRAFPRAFVVPRWRRVPEDAALSVLTDLAASSPTALREEAVLSEGDPVAAAVGTSSPAALTPSSATEQAVPGQAEIVASTPNRVRISLQSNAPGLLLLTDNHYPGWRAVVQSGSQSTAAPVLRADYTFRGVAVPAGASTVTLHFEPTSLRLGLFLAALALAAIAAMLGGAITSGRR